MCEIIRISPLTTVLQEGTSQSITIEVSTQNEKALFAQINFDDVRLLGQGTLLPNNRIEITTVNGDQEINWNIEIANPTNFEGTIMITFTLGDSNREYYAEVEV